MGGPPPPPPNDQGTSSTITRRPWTPPRLERGSDVLDDVGTAKGHITEVGTPNPSSTSMS